MKDEFANRQAMHLTVIGLLDKPEHKPAWENQPPAIFTAKSLILRTKVAALTLHIAEQEKLLAGLAEQKDREETELETIAHELGQVFADYLEDQGREGEAAEFDLSITRWRRLRDTALLAKTTLLETRLNAALLADAPGLAEYGITPADATAYSAELSDYREVIASPSGGIATRKALTAALLPEFREVSEILKSMDRLVPRFRTTPAGNAFADNWFTARAVRDLGANNPDPEPPTP